MMIDRRSMLAVLLAPLLFSFHLQRPANLLAPLNWQPNCVSQSIGGADVLASERLDVNGDSDLDWVVVFAEQRDTRILVALNQLPAGCQVILDNYLTSRNMTATDQQMMVVHRVELVELTGDDLPEPHVWLERSGGILRSEGAFHAIYAWQDGNLRQIFISEQCLAFSSFEFRNTSYGTKEIYRDEDKRCTAPFSSRRQYAVYRWNVSKFELVESGTVDKLTMYPPIWYVICVGALLLMISAILLVLRSVLHKRSSEQNFLR